MPRSLLERYTYSNFADLPPVSPEADFFFGGPARQRELVQLTKAQIALQAQTVTAFREATGELASVVRNELEYQTAALCAVVREGADNIVSSVDALSDRLSSELVEIRWQLSQLSTTNDQILHVLKRPRSTEAQELLEQGIRNLVNNKIEQAENRLIRALDLDNTDYQILRNLSVVELHKGNADRAANYLRDALTLPANLDDFARTEALWCLARVEYSEGEYATAADLAGKSLALRSNPRRVFQYGIYLILANETEKGISLLEDAIRSDPGLFVLTAVSPDLESNKARVTSLLDFLANEALSQLRSDCDQLTSSIPTLGILPHIPAESLEGFAGQVRALSDVLATPSYTRLRAAIELARELRPGPARFQCFSEAEQGRLRSEEEYQRAVQALAVAEADAAKLFKPYKFVSGHIVGIAGVGAFLGGLGGGAVGVMLMQPWSLALGLLGVPISVIVWSLLLRTQWSIRDGEVKKASERKLVAKSALDEATRRRDKARRQLDLLPIFLAT